MATQSIIVVDDFYPDPDKIRSIALSLRFERRPGATYPGREAISGTNWTAVRRRLRRYIDENVDGVSPKQKPFAQGKFRIALASDERRRVDRVHVDQQRWSAVIYLSKSVHCRDGLRLYRHCATGSTGWDDLWFERNFAHYYSLEEDAYRRKVLGYFKNPRNFEHIGTIPMAYNRAIILMSHVLHGSGKTFGTRVANGRLSQHFEFYSAP